MARNNRFKDYLSAGVYVITNLLNGKIYIGSTKNSFKERWGNHLNLLKKGLHENKYLNNSWLKHGEENFEFSILEEIPFELINNISGYEKIREQYWIDLFLPFDDNGYNIATQVDRPNPRVYTFRDRIDSSKSKCPDGYLVEFPNGLVLHTYNIAAFAESFSEFGLDDRQLAACARGESPEHKGFKLRYANPEKRIEYVSPFLPGLDGRKYQANNCQEYVLFDSEGTRYETSNIAYFCDIEKPELKGKALDLQSVARKESLIAHGWQCYKKGEEPEEFTPYEELRGFKKYRVINPEKELIEVTNLQKFCKDNNLKYRVFLKCAQPQYPNITYKNWYCFEWGDQGYLKIINPPEAKIIPTIEEPDYACVMLRWVGEMDFEEYKLQNQMNINKYLPEENFLQPNLSKIKNRTDTSYKSVYYFTKDFEFDIKDLKKPREVKPQRNTKRESKCSKTFKLTSPTGKVYTTEHLPNFAKKHNLNTNNLRQVSKGERKTHKGWVCKEVS